MIEEIDQKIIRGEPVRFVTLDQSEIATMNIISELRFIGCEVRCSILTKRNGMSECTISIAPVQKDKREIVCEKVRVITNLVIRIF